MSASPHQFGPGSIAPDGYRGRLVDLVRERLTKALGPKRVLEVMGDVLGSAGGQLETPDDLLHYADALVRKGGLIQAIGRSLKVQALLYGAVEP